MGHDNPPIQPPPFEGFPIPPRCEAFFRYIPEAQAWVFLHIDACYIDDKTLRIEGADGAESMSPLECLSNRHKHLAAGAAIVGWMEEMHAARTEVLKARELRGSGPMEERPRLSYEIRVLQAKMRALENNIALCFEWGRAHE